MCFRPPSFEGQFMKCPICGTELPLDATSCSACGATEADLAKGGDVAAPAAGGPPPAPGTPKAPGAPPAAPGTPKAPGARKR